MFGTSSTVLSTFFTNVEGAAKRDVAITLAETTIRFSVPLIGNILAVKPLRFGIPN